jgi:hypothetical protein
MPKIKLTKSLAAGKVLAEANGYITNDHWMCRADLLDFTAPFSDHYAKRVQEWLKNGPCSKAGRVSSGVISKDRIKYSGMTLCPVRYDNNACYIQVAYARLLKKGRLVVARNGKCVATLDTDGTIIAAVATVPYGDETIVPTKE